MDIITAILEIDSHAKDKLKRADEQKAELERKTAEECEKIIEGLSQRADKRIAEVEKARKENACKKLENINAEADRQIENLQKKYDENCEMWADEIFKAVTEQ